jgi:hypothetical protein
LARAVRVRVRVGAVRSGLGLARWRRGAVRFGFGARGQGWGLARAVRVRVWRGAVRFGVGAVREGSGLARAVRVGVGANRLDCDFRTNSQPTLVGDVLTYYIYAYSTHYACF